VRRLVECLNPRCKKKFWDKCNKNGETNRAYCRECENKIRQQNTQRRRNYYKRKRRHKGEETIINVKGEKENLTDYTQLTFLFSERQAKKRGTFVSGMPESGKTNIAKIIADHLLNKGYIIKCYDPSQAWLESSIPYFVVADEFDWKHIQKIDEIPVNQSIVYDISRLYPRDQKFFIGHAIQSDFKYICNNPKPPFWIIYIIEEAQMVIPTGSLRANYAQTTFHMVSVGRNFNQRYILLTQRPADVSVKALSRVGQAYFGQHWELNDIKRLSHLLLMDFKECREKLGSLQIGEFIYLNPYKKQIEKIQSPLFETTVKPQNYWDIIQPKESRKSWFKRIFL